MNAKHLMETALGNFRDEMDAQDEHYQWCADREMFYRDAHQALVLLRGLGERTMGMGYLTDLQASTIGAAIAALNELFPDTKDHLGEGKPF